MKKILYKSLLIVSVILIICFLIFIIKDYLNYNEFMSAPFYVYIIARTLEFIIPSIMCFIISKIIKNK